MEEEQFQKEYGAVLERSKQRRGDCPGIELLQAYGEGTLSPDEKNALEHHLTLCAVCQELVERIGQDVADLDDLSWRRIEEKLDQREVPWRDAPLRRYLSFFTHRPVMAVVGAVLMGAIAVVWMVRNPDVASPRKGSETRGSVIQIVEPAGTVEEVERFTWGAPPLNVTYQVEIRQNDEVIWSDTTSETSYRVPEPLSRLLRAGVAYRWRIRGVNTGGQVVVESAWTSFEIAK